MKRNVLKVLCALALTLVLFVTACGTGGGTGGGTGDDACQHTWEGGKCTKCQQQCTHQWAEDVCSICGEEKPAPPVNYSITPSLSATSIEVGDTATVSVVDQDNNVVDNFTLSAQNGTTYVTIAGNVITGVAATSGELITVTATLGTEECQSTLAIAVTQPEEVVKQSRTLLFNADDVEMKTFSENTVIGDFTITAIASKTVINESFGGVTIGDMSFTNRCKLGGTGSSGDSGYRAIKFTTDGVALVTVYAQSSGGADRTLNVVNSSGSVVKSITAPGTGVEAAPSTFLLDTAGTYYILSAGSGINIFAVKVEAPKTAVSLAVTQAPDKVSYYHGDVFDPMGLIITATYDDNSSDTYNAYTYSTQPLTAGQTEIIIYASDNDEVFVSVTIEVLHPVEISFTAHTEFCKTIYFVGETFDAAELVVTCKLDNGEDRVIAQGQFTVDSSSFDGQTAGVYTISISYGTFEAQNLVVTVIAEKVQPIENVVTLKVNANYTGIAGATDTNGVPQFAKMRQAVEYLKGANYPAEVVKIINVAAGTYKEKITLTKNSCFANLTLVGEIDGEGKPLSIMTYDTFAGARKLDGSAWGTDGSAATTVKSLNFSAINIWFENSFDYNASTLSDRQALAMLIEADMATFYNCHFTGWQDTLEAKAGRQYYKNCYIAGCTDFIFGNNATAFFENCTIHSLDRGSTSNNGYVCATKGFASGAGVDDVKYGYVFYQCDFTTDATTADGTVSLARPWNNYSKVAFIECEMASHISVKPYPQSSGAPRYQAMSGSIAPTEANVEFFEYANTGSGSITESVSGCTVIDATTAANYIDFSIIFALTNGNKVYDTTWNASQAMQDLANLG